MHFAAHVATASATNALSAIDKEVAIIRVGVLCQAPYEWHAHIMLGRNIGMPEEMLTSPEMTLASSTTTTSSSLTADAAEGGSANAGAGANGYGHAWSEKHRSILAATDELVNGFTVSDHTWARLEK